MKTNIFINIWTKNLDRARDFFVGLGFSINPQFTDQNSACIVIEENIFIMVIAEEFFKKFTKKELSDPSKSTESINTFSVKSKEAVDILIDKALSLGATENVIPEMQQGSMYGRSINDPDGHIWEIMWMDPKIIK